MVLSLLQRPLPVGTALILRGWRAQGFNSENLKGKPETLGQCDYVAQQVPHSYGRHVKHWLVVLLSRT